MALIACKECGRQVSTEANACPGCGAKVVPPKKKTSRLTWMFVVLFGAAGVTAVLQPRQERVTPPAKSTSVDAAPKTEAQKRRDAQLNAAGSVAAALKNASKDPQTFELKSAILHPDGTTCYEFRAKNSFNAMLAGAAVLTAKGKILIQERDGNAFVSAWNAACTHADGEQLAPLMHRLEIVRSNARLDLA